MDIAFNNGWLFTADYDAGFDKASSVRLPHTAREIPYNYIERIAAATVACYTSVQSILRRNFLFFGILCMQASVLQVLAL